MPKIAFEAGGSETPHIVTKEKLPPISSTLEKPQLIDDHKHGVTNGAYYADGSVETVVAMENMPKGSYIGK